MQPRGQGFSTLRRLLGGKTWRAPGSIVPEAGLLAGSLGEILPFGTWKIYIIFIYPNHISFVFFPYIWSDGVFFSMLPFLFR